VGKGRKSGIFVAQVLYFALHRSFDRIVDPLVLSQRQAVVLNELEADRWPFQGLLSWAG
jgi:hypothetical protein